MPIFIVLRFQKSNPLQNITLDKESLDPFFFVGEGDGGGGAEKERKREKPDEGSKNRHGKFLQREVLNIFLLEELRQFHNV